MSLLTAVGSQSVRPHVFLYPLGVWVVMAVLAVSNGGFRELALIPRLGEYVGHVVSTATLIVAILLVSFLYFRGTPIEYTYVELVLVGIIWTMLTVGFEFAVGYVEGTPVSMTIEQYDVLAGQVWIAVPLTLLFAPLLFGWYLSS